MKIKNKGQTAMEYLMTYGWAILIVIVVISALYSMGALNPIGETLLKIIENRVIRSLIIAVIIVIIILIVVYLVVMRDY